MVLSAAARARRQPCGQTARARLVRGRRERRGRPAKAQARRRKTTVVGRRGEALGPTPELVLRRRRITGSAELPDDVAGALLGRGLIDLEQYRALRRFGGLVRVMRLGFGFDDGSSAGAWRSILAGTAAGGVFAGPAGAEQARRMLLRLRRDIAPAAWAALSAAVEECWPADLAAFRVGLDHLVRWLPRLLRHRT